MKSDQATVQARVEEILQLRLVGALWTDIRHHAAEQKWEVGDRQLKRYVAAADLLLMKNVEKNHDRLMAFHYNARRALFSRAMAVSDYSTARQLLNDEAKLLDLYPKKRIEVTSVTDAEVEAAAVRAAELYFGVLSQAATPIPPGSADEDRLAG